MILLNYWSGLDDCRIIINFENQMMWDKPTIKIRDCNLFLDILSPINDFHWHEEILESQALNDASSHLKKILDEKYKPDNQ
jgi:hypothetical protein